LKQKVALKDKILRGSVDEKNITVESLFKNYRKTIHSFIDRRLRVVTGF
jgi:hypothetical protein